MNEFLLAACFLVIAAVFGAPWYLALPVAALAFLGMCAFRFVREIDADEEVQR